MVNTHTHTHKAALSFHCYFKGQVANSKFDKKGTRKILAALAKRMPGAFIAGLSISFEVASSFWKVGVSLLSERRRRKPPRGVWGHAPPENFEI